jgi:IS4 transposase
MENKIEKNYNLFNKCKSALRYEVNPLKRKRLVDVLYKIKLYGELIKDSEELSESEKYMLDVIDKRKIPDC